jgi:pentatricopeptide repeat protein
MQVRRDRIYKPWSLTVLSGKRAAADKDAPLGAVHLALLRCHADAGEFDVCLRVLREIKNGGGPMRWRIFQPLFQVEWPTFI